MSVVINVIICCMVVCGAVAGAPDPGGFNGALWGQSSAEVQKNVKATSWQTDPVQVSFPPDLKVAVFRTTAVVAGYNVSVKYYFQEDRFFQATVDFVFNDLVNFDFNYNVFRSVTEYYTAIRAKTLLLVNDVYALLLEKYGKKQPVFKGLDPRFVFNDLDRYVALERWNLRYHPYDFYLNIVTASYARWDFPHSRVFFSVNIAAPQKRFEYRLSLSSVDMTTSLQKTMNYLRSRGL